MSRVRADNIINTVSDEVDKRLPEEVWGKAIYFDVETISAPLLRSMGEKLILKENFKNLSEYWYTYTSASIVKCEIVEGKITKSNPCA